MAHKGHKGGKPSAKPPGRKPEAAPPATPPVPPSAPPVPPSAPAAAAAAGAASAGGTAAGPSTAADASSGSGSVLRRSLPVVARLWGVGLLGAGALAYAASSGSKKEPKPPPGDGAAPAANDGSGDAPPPGWHEGGADAFAGQEEQQQQQPGGHGEEPPPEEAQPPDDAEVEPVLVESDQVLHVLEDVLTKDAATMTQEIELLTQQAQQAGAGQAASGGDAGEAAAAAPGVPEAAAPEPAPAPAAPAPALPPAPRPSVPPPKPHPGLSPEARRLLGVDADLSPAGLIAAGTAQQRGPGDDWTDFRHRHKQAVVDSALLADVLGGAAAHVAAEVQGARAEAEAARRELEAQRAQQRRAVQQAAANVVGEAREAMARQAAQLAAAHSAEVVRERAQRLAAVDQVRQRLNALQAALSRRGTDQHTSHSAHELAVGAFALQEALEEGRPLAPAVAYLRRVAASDPLVSLALEALPPAAVESPVWTRQGIADRFDAVESAARQLAPVPPAGGGLLTVAAAKLAAALKISERGRDVPVGGSGIDARLAAARGLLGTGDLQAAAAELEAAASGTAAARAVAGWVAAARERAAAEQATRLLEAHAAALAVSRA